MSESVNLKKLLLVITINPIRSGLFQTANDPGGGGGALKASIKGTGDGIASARN